MTPMGEEGAKVPGDAAAENDAPARRRLHQVRDRPRGPPFEGAVPLGLGGIEGKAGGASELQRRAEKARGGPHQAQRERGPEERASEPVLSRQSPREPRRGAARTWE